MKTIAAVVLTLSLAACSGRKEVTLRPNANLEQIKKIVVLPFTDDPMVPASGLKTAQFFSRAVQTKLKNIQFVSPSQLLKEEGIDVGTALNDDTVADAPGAIEPVLNRIFGSTQAVASINPAHESDIAKRHGADAVVRGSVFYEPGAGIVESMVAGRRATAASVAVHVVDTKTGQVLLAFNQQPVEITDRMTPNQILRQTAEKAAEQIERKWQ
jgi:hypothetical protein